MLKVLKRDTGMMKEKGHEVRKKERKKDNKGTL